MSTTIKIEAGEQTEDLLQFVLSQIDDQMLDTIEIDREVAPQSGLASEPITTTILLTLASTAVIAISRLIERWMEERRQLREISVVAEGFSQSSEEGRALTELARSHSQVMVSFGALSVSSDARAGQQNSEP